MMTIDVAEIRSAKPCAKGWRRFLRSIGRDVTSLGLDELLELRGVQDTKWVIYHCPSLKGVKQDLIKADKVVYQKYLRDVLELFDFTWRTRKRIDDEYRNERSVLLNNRTKASREVLTRLILCEDNNHE